jgi:hypothetical protein
MAMSSPAITDRPDSMSSGGGALEKEIPVALPADEPVREVGELSTLGLVELLLKNPARLDAINRDEHRSAVLIPRFLCVALACYLLFAVSMILILSTASVAAYPRHLFPVKAPGWSTGSALGLAIAYNFGLVATTGICLPSFYFFALLAGVRLSMLQIVGQVLRCKATSAVFLVGILPIYVAVTLGFSVFKAPERWQELWFYAGLVLPFVAGLAGVHALYHSIERIAKTLPAERRYRRECFLRRLTVSWAACYTAVAPVMIYRLWESLAAQLG